MNVDKPSDSASSSKSELTSKYFTKGNDMDDSLSEFQEKKKNIAVPKKVPPNKSRKKPVKRTKGQKDIKSLFNKNNELVKYSNEFDNVCKQSGVDVDSEQLQLAIALSISLQDTQNTPKDDGEEKSLTSQGRVSKIRTLQEYGFKVPEAKILVDSNKRVKKTRKNYKLLTLTDIEKQAIVSERYAEVLSRNLDLVDDTLPISISNDTLFYKTTNAWYEEIQDNAVFVVSTLFEKTTTPIDRHKDWSEIPGRPQSPVFEGPFISFNDISCTQNELDSILSCALKTTQELLNKKLRINSELFNVEIGIDNSTNMSYANKECTEIAVHNANISPKPVNDERKELPTTCNTFLKITEQARCISPDVFGDEDSLVMDTSKKSETDQKVNKNNFNSILSSDVMDLTECVKISSNINVDTNSTKQTTEDFMEIINVQASNVTKNTYEEIDLTQNNEDPNDDTVEYCLDENAISNERDESDIICVVDDVLEENYKMRTNNEVVDSCFEHNSSLTGENLKDTGETMDLTQSSNSSGELPDIIISGKNKESMDETIIINKHCYDIERHNESVVNDNQEIDILLEKGPEVSNSKQNIFLCDVDDTINEGFQGYEAQEKVYDKIDLTQGILEENVGYADNISKNPSYEESQELTNSNKYKIDLIQFYSGEINSLCDDNKAKGVSYTEKQVQRNISESIDLTQPNFEEINNLRCEVNEAHKDISDNIDLTQSENSSLDHSLETKSNNILHDSTRSPKYVENINNISVDYDEMFDNVVACCSNTTKSSRKSESNTTKSDQNVTTSSTSGTFEISDKELNYSITRCREENIGDISVLEELPIIGRSPSCNLSKINIILPEEIKNTEKSDHNFNTEAEYNDVQKMSPLKDQNKTNYDMIKTPSIKEYIIKTNEVTPMPNYEAMSTPEMNQELDKYGVKPFKRKRAIKLLTYIYNQTHPIVDYCVDESSPSKKRKTNIEVKHSPKKSPRRPSPKNSPRKNRQSPSKGDKENIYEVTDSTPVIKDIECNPEDWVFQTREKAKISSCRVPLHIAFHNYVHSRRSLREAILCYEPINIDTVHKDLVAIGYRYNPKDLLKFMDKKCITVKTADNDKRNKR